MPRLSIRCGAKRDEPEQCARLIWICACSRGSLDVGSNKNLNRTSTLETGLSAFFGLGGGGGPVSIHINGYSHDPEVLPTLVQRRIDETMNWRTTTLPRSTHRPGRLADLQALQVA